MGKIVSEWLITAFVREGRFEVIERKLLGEVLEEQKMVEAGIVNHETASEIGKLLGVKVIISGSVAKIGTLLEVNARIVDVTSASIITAESVSSSQVDSLRSLVNQMAKKIIKNFPLEGYIAHRNNNDVVIDLGRQSGVKEGMSFLVYKEGDVVKHPKTGEILYVEKIKTGLIEVTGVQEKISTGVIVQEEETDSIGYGDLVKSAKNGESRVTKQPDQIDDVQKVIPPPYDAKNSTTTTINDLPPGQLYVKTEPLNARIRVLNIVPKYYQGIPLPQGNYHIEVSATGYARKTEWHVVQSGEVKKITIKLTKYSSSTSSPLLQKYFSMLRSRDSAIVRKAARDLHKNYRKNSSVITAAHEVLRDRYRERPNDSHFIDGMAYLCNILGNSRQARHRDLLTTVYKKSSSRKLRSYAKKNLRLLTR